MELENADSQPIPPSERGMHFTVLADLPADSVRPDRANEMKITIRPATGSDAQQMVELLNPIIERGNLTMMRQQLSLAEQQAFIDRFPTAGIFHVAEAIGGRLVAMQDVLPNDNDSTIGEISTFVCLDHLRQGIGSLLMNETIVVATRRGFCELRATIRQENTGAIQFYQQCGFQDACVPYRHSSTNLRLNLKPWA